MWWCASIAATEMMNFDENKNKTYHTACARLFRKFKKQLMGHLINNIKYLRLPVYSGWCLHAIIFTRMTRWGRNIIIIIYLKLEGFGMQSNFVSKGGVTAVMKLQLAKCSLTAATPFPYPLPTTVQAMLHCWSRRKTVDPQDLCDVKFPCQARVCQY